MNYRKKQGSEVVDPSTWQDIEVADPIHDCGELSILIGSQHDHVSSLRKVMDRVHDFNGNLPYIIIYI